MNDNYKTNSVYELMHKYKKANIHVVGSRLTLIERIAGIGIRTIH